MVTSRARSEIADSSMGHASSVRCFLLCLDTLLRRANFSPSLSNSPKIPITFHDKEVRPAWFDIKSFPWKEVEDSDTDHYFASTRAINDVVREERDRLINAERKRRGKELGAPGTNEEREWASKRILIGGFSQGGVMSLLAGLTNEERLGGIFVFSGMLPVRDLLPEVRSRIPSLGTFPLSSSRFSSSDRP